MDDTNSEHSKYFVLPLMQGFVGQRAFTVNRQPDKPSEAVVCSEEDSVSVIEAQEKDYLITLISRRSVKRPGLRYLRRGVDDGGNAANNGRSSVLHFGLDYESEDISLWLLTSYTWRKAYIRQY